MNLFDAVLVMAGVFLIAFVFAPVGMGGGMLFAPLLHYGAGWPIDGTLLAVSLALTWSVSIGSGRRHRLEGFYDEEATKSALYGALMGALIGVGVVNALGDDLDTVFKLLSIGMLIWALVKTWKKQRSDGAETTAAPQESTSSIQHMPLRIGSGIGGALSSVLGIGAGVIYVPMLQQQAGLEARTSIGSSLSIMMVVVPVAIIALLTTAPSGMLSGLASEWWWLFPLPFLAYGGATAGAKFGIERITQENIMRVFMALVAVVLVRYIVDVTQLNR
jgi:uncharacterized membrane protein YfcA